MTVNICDRFMALNPLTIRQARAHEVFLLIARLGKYTKKEARNRDRNGNRIVRRPAGDNWF